LGWFSGNVREGYHYLYENGNYFCQQDTLSFFILTKKVDSM